MAGAVCGTSEPIQSGKTIRELVLELKEQLEEAGTVPVILAGHSWGAFLAALFAGAYPEMVEKLVLVGCPPLTAGYVPMIGERRRRNLGRRRAGGVRPVKSLVGTGDAGGGGPSAGAAGRAGGAGR